MKAVTFNRYGSVDVLQVQELTEPVPKPDEVLVKIAAASINPIDWKIRRGDLRLLSGFKFPHLLGSDFAGVIEAVGEQVRDFQTGDEVYGSLSPLVGGAYAQYVSVRADVIALKPKTATFAQAAAVPIAGLTALQSLCDLGHLEAGDKVLVNGASGGVGTFAIQIASALGATVTGVCSAKNLELVKQLGAERTIDYQAQDFTTNTTQYNIILDAVGNHSFFECQKVLATDGIYITTLPSPEIFGAFVLSSFFPRKKAKLVLAQPRRPDLQVLAQLMDEGKVVPVIERIYPLSEIAEAHRQSESHRSVGKIVLSVAED